MKRYDISENGEIKLFADDGKHVNADEAESSIAELEIALADCQSRLERAWEAWKVFKKALGPLQSCDCGGCWICIVGQLSQRLDTALAENEEGVE